MTIAKYQKPKIKAFIKRKMAEGYDKIGDITEELSEVCRIKISYTSCWLFVKEIEGEEIA